MNPDSQKPYMGESEEQLEEESVFWSAWKVFKHLLQTISHNFQLRHNWREVIEKKKKKKKNEKMNMQVSGR